MIDAAIRQIQGRIALLADALGYDWVNCPESFLEVKDWDKLPHAHPTCHYGESDDGYSKWTCKTCKGSGEVLKKR